MGIVEQGNQVATTGVVTDTITGVIARLIAAGTTPPIMRPPMPALEAAALSAADFGSPRALTIERIGEETYLLHVK